MRIAFPNMPMAGLIIDFVSGTAGVIIVLTGLLAGALRALAVLGRQSAEEVEWHTAAGFVGGFAFSAAVIAIDVVLG